MRDERRPLPTGLCVVATLGLAGAAGTVATAGATTQARAGDEDAGAVVYQQHCAMCHGDDATGMMGMHPALTGAVDRLGEEGVEVTVRNGRDTSPPMPAFGDRLSDDELADVVAYVASLPDGPRNFGPGGDSGMGGMGGGMMDGGSGWLLVLVVVLVAAVSGLVGYLIGRRARS